MRLIAVLFVVILGIHSNSIAAPDAIKFVPESVYVPSGFDSNDTVKFAIEGNYPSSCYKMAGVHADVNEIEKKVYVENEAINYAHFGADVICLDVLVPYERVVDLQTVSVPGVYEVLFAKEEGGYEKVADLNIAPASSASPDEHHYAPVTKVSFEYDDYGKAKPVAVLKGEYTNTCMNIDELRLIHDENSNVVDVLPIMHMDKGNCRPVEPEPFVHRVDLSAYKGERLLIHVRSLNGQARLDLVSL